MSTPANTRLFAGSIIKVDDLSEGYITSGEIRDINYSSTSTEIDTTTAASDIEDESRNGLPDGGEMTLSFFMALDDAFQQEMKTMADGREVRTFKLVLPEGTNCVATFDAMVIDMPKDGDADNVVNTKLVLHLNTTLTWAAT